MTEQKPIPENLEQEIKDLVVEVLEVDPDQVRLDGSLEQIMQIDSVALLEVLVTLERRYGVGLSEEDLKQVTQLGQVVELIRRKMEDKARTPSAPPSESGGGAG
ncbi:MAG: acyl carrier protein [candidate division FCPU426 bacterium]